MWGDVDNDREKKRVPGYVQVVHDLEFHPAWLGKLPKHFGQDHVRQSGEVKVP